jgi:hypothetical protein
MSGLCWRRLMKGIENRKNVFFKNHAGTNCSMRLLGLGYSSTQIVRDYWAGRLANGYVTGCRMYAWPCNTGLTCYSILNGGKPDQLTRVDHLLIGVLYGRVQRSRSTFHNNTKGLWCSLEAHSANEQRDIDTP